MYAHGSIAEPRVGFCELDRRAGFFQIGACDEEFLDAGGAGAGEDLWEVGFVCPFAVVDAGEDWVGEVYADLFLTIRFSRVMVL